MCKVWSALCYSKKATLSKNYWALYLVLFHKWVNYTCINWMTHVKLSILCWSEKWWCYPRQGQAVNTWLSVSSWELVNDEHEKEAQYKGWPHQVVRLHVALGLRGCMVMAFTWCSCAGNYTFIYNKRQLKGKKHPLSFSQTIDLWAFFHACFFATEISSLL